MNACLLFAAITSTCFGLTQPMLYGRAERYEPEALVTLACQHVGADVRTAHAIVKVESNWDPTVTGKAGEVGLFQIKPTTAYLLGWSGSTKDLYRPEINAFYGCLHVARAMRGCTDARCVAARHNQGLNKKRLKLNTPYVEKVRRVFATMD